MFRSITRRDSRPLICKVSLEDTARSKNQHILLFDTATFVSCSMANMFLTFRCKLVENDRRSRNNGLLSADALLSELE